MPPPPTSTPPTASAGSYSADGTNGAGPTSAGGSLLRELPLFTLLPPDVRELVINSFVGVRYSFGAPIVREGDSSDALFVLVAGSARVVKESSNGAGELQLGRLKPGDVFGEMGLLEDTKRTATVRASGDVEALRLDRSVFDALVRTRPELRTHLELQVRHRHLTNLFREFPAFAALPPEAHRTLLGALEPVVVAPGDIVIRQGDPAGPMYIVEEGRFRAFVEENGHRRYLAYIRRGEFFGELSVLKGAPRAATIEAVAPGRLLRLRTESLAALLAGNPDFRRQIEERVAQYDFKSNARVPLDFAEELLPAELRSLDAPAAEPAPDKRGTASPPFADTDGHFVKRGKRIRRIPYVRQIDEMDCGAASLAMVCRHYGREVSLARIRQLVHTSLDGTSLRGICTAAQELGLAARAVKGSPANVADMPLPAIIHWDANHWVVLHDLDATHVRLTDPALGARRLPRAEFEKRWSGYAALFDYTEAFADAPVSAPSAAWLWRFVRPFTGVLAKALGLALVVSGLQMMLPVFTQLIVDRVLVENDLSMLRIVMVGMVGVLLFMTAAMLIQRYLLSFIAVRIDSQALDFLTRRMLALPMSYFSTRRTGDIQRRLAGMRQVREFAVQHGVAALTASVQLVAALALMFVYSGTLTLVFLATVPVYGGLMYFSARWLRPLFSGLEEADGKYTSHQIDAIKGIETVKALGAESTFREQMLSQFLRVASRRFQADYTIMTYQGIVQLVSFLSIALFLWFGAREVLGGRMTIGALVAFNSLVALANAPIGELLGLWDGVQIARVLLDRLDDVFSQEPEQGADHSKLLPVRSLEGRVTLRHLGFRYGGSEAPPILDDITIDIPAGKTVAIVGRSGSGKTTFVKCLAGLLEPTEGTILFDGIDQRTLSYRELRRQIGFVLQDNFLFNETIARNIALGEQEPDMERVMWAAQAASADSFIDRLPMGYETKVGESGLAISGGQKQRIAIARALFHRPSILIFDEATSALDTESERAVQGNLERLLAGRTSFIIAHRLSTVRNADMILVLEQGRIAEHGTHDELMDRRGLYYYLASQQLGGGMS